MLASDVVESRGRDVVCLALAHQTVVLEDVLLFRVVNVRLGLEDPLCLASTAESAWKSLFPYRVNALGDIVKLHGLAEGLAGCFGELLPRAEHGPRDNHHLAAVLVVEAVGPLSGEDMGCYKGDVLVALVHRDMESAGDGGVWLTPRATGANLWDSPIGRGSKPSFWACFE